MPHSLNLVLNPSPPSFYTYEDVVSGKVFLESSHSDTLNFVHICFSGVVHSEVNQYRKPNTPSGSGGSTKCVDKEVLFQFVKTFHQAQKVEQLGRKVSYEWPFEFGFVEDWGQGFELPSSGKYHDSKVEYKISAVIGKEGEDEEKLKQKINPEKKPSNFHETDFRLWARKQIGEVVERKINFIQIRSEAIIDDYTPPPFSWPLEISTKHLPYLEQDIPTSERKGIFHSSHQRNYEEIPFSVDCQIARTVVQGLPFLIHLSISSTHPVWSQSPPTITLTKLKIDLRVITIERAVQSSVKSVSDIPIFHSKDLHLPLGPQALDLGTTFSLSLTGEGVTPSFNTRLLRREYHLPTDVTITVGGKSFEAKFAAVSVITILPSLIATGHLAYHPPSSPFGSSLNRPKEIHLQYSHLGRISQIGGGILRPDSILEAALTLSRLLTENEIIHSFPGGSLVRLHTYKPSDGKINDTDFDTVSDEIKILSVFREVPNCAFRYAARGDVGYDEDDLTFRFEESDEKEFKCDVRLVFAPHKAKLNTLQQKMNDHNWIKKTSGRNDEVKLDPIVLFNYRLECAVTRDRLEEEEKRDFESLEKAFGTDLREGARKGRINVNMARVAMGRHEGLMEVLRRIGIVGGEEGRGWEEERWTEEKEERWTEKKEERWTEKKEERWTEEKEQVRDFDRGSGGKEEKIRNEEVEKEGLDRERKKWDDEGAQGDRNWAWKQMEKERIGRLKKAFLDRKKGGDEKKEEERCEEKREDWDKDEEELVRGFKKSPQW